MIYILKTKHIDLPDIRIILNLFWNQTVKIKVDNELFEKNKIIQGCILSVLLFTIYSKGIFEDINNK